MVPDPFYGCFSAFDDPDAIWSMVFDATYKAHGGSGSNLTVTEALEMPLDRLVWWVEKVGEMRSAESDAIRRASGK